MVEGITMVQHPKRQTHESTSAALLLLLLAVVGILNPTQSFLLPALHRSSSSSPLSRCSPKSSPTTSFQSPSSSVWFKNTELPASSSSSSTATSSGSSSSNNKKNSKKKKNKSKKGSEKAKRVGKPRSKLLSFNDDRIINKSSNNHNMRGEGNKMQKPRIKVDYFANRNPDINKFRLLSATVQCPHNPDCPSCVFCKRVGNLPITESARRYFSSTAVRRRRGDVLQNSSNQQYAVETADDGFFEIVVPSEVEGWRTQAKLAVAAPTTSRWSQEDEGCIFGLYAKGSHTVVPLSDCTAHHPSINRAVAVLQHATRKVRTTAYDRDDFQRAGGLRYVQLQVERSTGKVCLTLVWNAATLKETQPYLSRLVKQLTKHKRYDDNIWHSIWCNCNDGRGNAIFNRNPNRWHRLMGPEYLREPLPSFDDCDDNDGGGDENINTGWLYFTPQTFRQGNMEGFDILAKDVARAIPGGSRVCELYAGVGVLGLTALQYHHHYYDDGGGDDGGPLEWIRCSDENPTNLKCFSKAVKSLDPDVTTTRSSRSLSSSSPKSAEGKEMTIAELAQILDSGDATSPSSLQEQPQEEEKASYLVASAAEALQSGQALGANVLVVDPPRKGLESEVLDELCKPINPNQPYATSSEMLSMTPYFYDHEDRINWVNDVKLLVYVSCGFEALARDAEQLLNSEHWILESATGYILFPGSNHVETVCVFSRSSSRR